MGSKAKDTQISAGPKPQLEKPTTDVGAQAEQPPTPADPKTFASLFKENRNGYKLGTTLNYVKNDDDFVTVLDHQILSTKEAWGHALIGYFAGKFPGKQALLRICDAWKVDYTYIPHSSGWLVFKFKTEEDMESVRYGGPYYAFGRGLMLKTVPEGFEFERINDSVVPVWVRFEQLAPHLWGDDILSGMASKIGRPLYTDMLTRTKERLDYARVLVEVDLSMELKSSVDLKFSNNRVKRYGIFYEDLPTFCTHCNSFKHPTGSCKSKKAIPPAQPSVEVASPPKITPTALQTPPVPPAVQDKPAEGKPAKGKEPMTPDSTSHVSESPDAQNKDPSLDDEFQLVQSKKQRRASRSPTPATQSVAHPSHGAGPSKGAIGTRKSSRATAAQSAMKANQPIRPKGKGAKKTIHQQEVGQDPILS